MDNRDLWDKVVDRLMAYWTGFCVGWSTFDSPGIFRLLGIFLIGIIAIFAIGLFIALLKHR